LPLYPLFKPQIQYIMQIYVSQHRRYYPLNAKDNLFEFSRKVSIIRGRQNA